jgi:hypothetical protein
VSWTPAIMLGFVTFDWGELRVYADPAGHPFCVSAT